MRKKLRRPWTAEDDARLRSLLAAGDSVSLAAAKLKRTASAVKSRSGKLGVPLLKTRSRAKSLDRI
jgi:hypothetical protein